MRWEKVEIRDLRKGMALAWSPGEHPTTGVGVLSYITLDAGQEPRLILADGTDLLVWGQFWKQVEEPVKQLDDGVYQVIDDDGDTCLFSLVDGTWYGPLGESSEGPAEVIAKIMTEPVA